MKKEKTTIVVAGVLIGVISAMLVFFGNPANMGFCIACFLRDTTGALGLHSAAAVQYIRPEIIGLVLGACIVSLITKEFRPRGGSDKDDPQAAVIAEATSVVAASASAVTSTTSTVSAESVAYFAATSTVCCT